MFRTQGFVTRPWIKEGYYKKKDWNFRNSFLKSHNDFIFFIENVHFIYIFGSLKQLCNAVLFDCSSENQAFFAIVLRFINKVVQNNILLLRRG